MSIKKRDHLRWQGGPPDYMWWLAVITQLIAIALQVFNVCIQISALRQ